MAEYRNDTARTVWRKPHKTWLTLAAGLALAAAACSGGSDSGAVPTVQLTSTAPTTVATTTTTEPTTTTEDPAIAYERDVAEITEVYDKSVQYLVSIGLTIDLVYLEKYVGEPLLSTKIKNTQAWSDQGNQVGSATYDIHMLNVEVNGDQATSLSCNFDRIEMLTASGQVLIPADTERYLRESHFERSSTGWKIVNTGYANGEATTCEV